VKRLSLLAASTSILLGGCALKSDIRRVEGQLQRMQEMQVEAARADSVRAALLAEIIATQREALDSLAQLQRRFMSFQGTMQSDMTSVQRQLVQVQELTGQSQQRLTELRRQVDQRLSQAPPTVSGSAQPGDSGRMVEPGGAGGPTARELHDLSLQQLRRGSPTTARAGFTQLVNDYPDDPLAADAWFFIGESWESTAPDSAVPAYERVARDHQDSRRAPTALYRLGLLAERRNDRDGARLYFQRVVAGYPRSDEAELARAKLNTPEE